MSTDRDVTRTVRSWLEEGVTALPDRVLDAVLDQVPATPQRRVTSWPARRITHMNQATRIALATAAVVAVALIGVNFIGGQKTGTLGPVAATPTQRPQQLPAGGELEPGTYSITRQDWTQVPFTFTVPAGWANRIGFITKHAGEPDEVMLTAWIVTHIYADACQWKDTLFEVGGTADEMADALAEQGAREVNGPIDVVVGGYPAKQIELSVPAGLDVATCDDGEMRSWPSSASDETTGWTPRPGQTDILYIIDVDGARILIGTTRGPDASDEDVSELEGVIESIRFNP